MCASALQRVCKPHIVDLLRHFDQNRYISPRIRYASVRSKPELIRDIARHFGAAIRGTLVLLEGRFRLERRLPSFAYCTRSRTWLVDGEPKDFPHLTRERPRFAILRQQTLLQFVVISPPEAPPPSGSAPSS